MYVKKHYLETLCEATWWPRELLIFHHEGENFVFACQPGMTSWLTIPPSPGDARLVTVRYLPVDVHLGLHWLSDPFTWNELVLHSWPTTKPPPKDNIRNCEKSKAFPQERDAMRRWLEHGDAIASLTTLHPETQVGGGLLRYVLRPQFRKLLPLLGEAESLATTLVSNEQTEVFGISISLPGNVRIYCATPCVFHYPPILDDEPQEVVE